jgi:uncharacterized protein HemX
MDQDKTKDETDETKSAEKSVGGPTPPVETGVEAEVKEQPAVAETVETPKPDPAVAEPLAAKPIETSAATPNEAKTPMPPTPAKIKHGSFVPVVIAVLVVLMLVVIGFVAMNVDEDTGQDESNQTTDQTQPADTASADEELNQIEQATEDIDAASEEIDQTDLTDENIGL